MKITTPPLPSSSQPKPEPLMQKIPSITDQSLFTGSRNETRVKMNRMRLRIAQRLKDAQNTYAMLTTFNEVDMRSSCFLYFIFLKHFPSGFLLSNLMMIVFWIEGSHMNL